MVGFLEGRNRDFFFRHNKLKTEEKNQQQKLMLCYLCIEESFNPTFNIGNRRVELNHPPPPYGTKIMPVL